MKKKECRPVIHDQTLGEGSKTIILTHGLPSSLQEWGRMAPNLVSSGYRTIALDLPGHGDSFKPAEIERYTADIFFTDFEKWISGLNLEKAPILIGHSFGGYLSLRYTLEHQPAVGGLVLIDPFLARDQLAGINRLLLSWPQAFSFLLKNAPLKLVKSALWAGSLVRRKFKLQSFLSKSELHQMALDFKRCSPSIACLPKSLGDISANFADLKIPVLLIWGKHDSTLSASWYGQIISKFPHITGKALNAGHNPHLSNFDEACPIILEFLASI